MTVGGNKEVSIHNFGTGQKWLASYGSVFNSEKNLMETERISEAVKKLISIRKS
jgi:hypothetical protein